METLLPGISAEQVPTSRLTVTMLSVPGRAWPPQPMVAQTRAVLDGYAGAGGRYREVVIEDAGHGPHLDRPEQFLAALTQHLSTS